MEVPDENETLRLVCSGVANREMRMGEGTRPAYNRSSLVCRGSLTHHQTMNATTRRELTIHRSTRHANECMMCVHEEKRRTM